MHVALFWEPQEDKAVRCNLCRQRCTIKDGRRGLCGVRANRAGTLYSLVYGRLTAAAVDPIEKKPLYHVLPGTQAFSIAARGCNFRCLHCQNCRIARVDAGETFADDRRVTPTGIVKAALQAGCRSIAYTYTEPVVYYELAAETARLAAEAGLKNIFVTNGYIAEEALRALTPVLDAANIDLKFFDDTLYRKVCGARLQPVLDVIRLHHELGVWIEVTTLVIPSYNDAPDHLRAIARFLASIDPRIPWHVTAFYPCHQMTGLPATPPATLRRARAIGLEEGLLYVYTGNIRDAEGGTTYCPQCGRAVIRRPLQGPGPAAPTGMICAACRHPVAGVWQ